MAGPESQYNKEYSKALNEYSLYSAGQDQSINSLVNIVTSKLGEQLREPLRDLALAVQSLTGIGNKGVQSAISTLSGIQNYGVPGMLPSGGNGTIGGQTIASLHAAQAVQNQILSNFTNPITGAASSRSYGLNQAEMGKAAGWAMSTGMQYSGGVNMFQTSKVDDAYRHEQLLRGREVYNRTGNRSLYDQARELQTGQMHTTMTGEGEKIMNKAMEDAAATLGSIRRVMGGKAMEDLDDTMRKLFGGDASKFGLRAARMRMAEIEASASYYGGKEAAASAYTAAAATVGTSSAIVNAQAAGAIEKAARAGVRGNLKSQGVGYDISPESHADYAGRMGDTVGNVLQDEKEFLLMERSLKAKGSASEAEKSQIDELYRARNAARTPEELAAVRSRAYALSQSFMPGKTLEDFGGQEQALKDLGPQGSARFTAQGLQQVQQGSQAAAQRYFQQDEGTNKLLGLSAKDAGVLGLGISNMDPMLQAQLGKVLQSGGNLDEFRKTAGADDTLGVNADEFWNLLKQGKLTQEGVARFGAAKDLPQLKRLGFTSKSQMAQQSEEDYNAYARKNYLGEQKPQDFVDELLKGVTGNRDWTNVEKLNEVMRNAPSRVKRLSTDQDRISGSDENLKVLQGLNPEELRALSAKGMPPLTDSEAVKKWMASGAGSQAIGEVISSGSRTGAFSQGAFVFSEEGEGHAAADRLSKQAMKKGSPFGQEAPTPAADETAGGYQARLKQYIASKLRSGGEDELISNTLEGGKDLDEVLKSDMLSQEQKDALFGKVAKKREELTSQIDKYTKMAETGGVEDGKSVTKEAASDKVKELTQKRMRLEEMGNKYISTAGQSVNAKDMVTINAPTVVINTKDFKTT